MKNILKQEKWWNNNDDLEQQGFVLRKQENISSFQKYFKVIK